MQLSNGNAVTAQRRTKMNKMPGSAAYLQLKSYTFAKTAMSLMTKKRMLKGAVIMMSVFAVIGEALTVKTDVMSF